MDALKLKIFDVLTEKISVSEFENWLYSSELLDEKLKENSLMFEVVNVNYKLENSLKMLKNIASTIFDDEDFLVIKIEDNCRKIINTNEPEKIKDYVFNIIQDYNFDIEARNQFGECLDKVVKHFELLEFQVERLSRDKTIMHNLLTKTSSELTVSLEKFEKESREIASILDSTPVMIYVKGKGFNVEMINKEFASYFKINNFADKAEFEEVIHRNNSYLANSMLKSYLLQMRKKVLKT